MAKTAQVIGVKELVKRIATLRDSTAKGMERGYVKAGKFLQKKSQEVVPIDTGALRASAFTRKEGSGFQTKVTVGYTQSYAIYVHENLEARHAPGKIAKYLEKPARDYRAEMLEIIKKEAVK